MTSRFPVRTFAAACVGLSWLLAGCSDKITVNSPTGVQTGPNQAPRIIAQGPSWDATPIDVGRVGAPRPYVIVADDDGIGDVSGAFFVVETAIIHRFISRPDSIPGQFFCTFVAYTDTVGIRGLVPTTYSGIVENCPMTRGPYTTNHFSSNVFDQFAGYGGIPCSALPRIELASPYFGPPVAPCGPQLYEVFSRFGIYPPAVPTAYDVSVTYLDVEYRGIRAVVYDAAGASATANFPNLRLIYMTAGERQAPP